MEIYEKPVEEKTLYVCVNNVGRSQMAAEFHKHSKEDPGGADSAGILVDDPGGRVGDWIGGASTICAAMDEKGLPIADNQRTQYVDELADEYKRVIFMLELGQMPTDYDLQIDGKGRRYWTVQDPRGLPIEAVRGIRDNIELNVGILAVNPCAELIPVYS